MDRFWSHDVVKSIVRQNPYQASVVFWAGSENSKMADNEFIAGSFLMIFFAKYFSQLNELKIMISIFGNY